VDFYQPVDAYQRDYRATHYAVLFIALTFMALFLWEHTLGAPVHAMQYAMTGAALSVFYLVLTAVSEHLDFAASYGLAASSMTGLLSIYFSGVFEVACGGDGDRCNRGSLLFSVVPSRALGGLRLVVRRTRDILSARHHHDRHPKNLIGIGLPNLRGLRLESIGCHRGGGRHRRPGSATLWTGPDGDVSMLARAGRPWPRFIPAASPSSGEVRRGTAGRAPDRRPNSAFMTMSSSP